MDDVEEYFWGKIALRVRGLQARGITLSSFQRCQWKANIHSTGGPSCHDFPRFVIISEKSRPEVGNRWLWSSQNGGFLGKKTPYGQIFTNVFQNPTCGHGNTSFCKFREIWPTGSRWNRASFNGPKKQKFGSPSRCRFSWIAPKICQGQLQTMYSEFPKFHPNPFTSGGVTAEQVNIVQTCHKVFAILGEASASSPSKKGWQ